MKILNPNTFVGSIITGIISGLILLLVGWFSGPLKWPWENHRLRQLIKSNRKFNFIYNPENPANKRKDVIFLPNGLIGEGRNDNENSWRVRKGKLEIFKSDNKIYSRFKFHPRSGRLVHTNDPDCRSILGQYFEPLMR